jgi:hypothetical protein
MGGLMSPQHRRVRNWFCKLHIAAAVLHMLNAVILLALVFGQGRDWHIPLVYRYVLWERVDDSMQCNPQTNPCVIREVTRVLTNVSLGTLVALFSILSVVNHAVYGGALLATNSDSNSVGWRIITSYTDATSYRNALRWAEYSVSAGVMLFIIAALAGLSSLYDLLWVHAIVFALMWFGHAIDCAQTNFDRAVLYCVSLVLHTLGWAPIVVAFTLGTGSSDAPAAVKAIIWVLLTLYAAFGAVPAFQYFRPGTNKNLQAIRNQQAETAYVVLSFVAKTLLTWLVYSGVFARDQFGIEVLEQP